jgi:hypothetical protein
MLRLAADENFNNDILRGLLRRKPDLDSCAFKMLAFPGRMTRGFSNGQHARGVYCSLTTLPQSQSMPLSA